MKLLICLIRLMGVGILILTSPARAAEDTIYLEETLISGNQELPKVLYILPWRDMTTELLPIRTLQYEETNVMTPVYPADYRREIAYREQLKQLAEHSAAAPVEKSAQQFTQQFTQQSSHQSTNLSTQTSRLHKSTEGE